MKSQMRRDVPTPENVDINPGESTQEEETSSWFEKAWCLVPVVATATQMRSWHV